MNYMILCALLAFLPVIGADETTSLREGAVSAVAKVLEEASFQPVTFSGRDPSRPASEPSSLGVMTLASASEGSPTFCVYDYLRPKKRAIRVESAPELGTKLLPRMMKPRYYTSRACRETLGHCIKPKPHKPELRMYHPSLMPGVLNMTASVFIHVASKVRFNDSVEAVVMDDMLQEGHESCYGWYQEYEPEPEYSYEYSSDDDVWAGALVDNHAQVVACDEDHVRSVFRKIEDGEYNLEYLPYEIGQWPVEFVGLGQSLINEINVFGALDEDFLRDLKDEYFYGV